MRFCYPRPPSCCPNVAIVLEHARELNHLRHVNDALGAVIMRSRPEAGITCHVAGHRITAPMGAGRPTISNVAAPLGPAPAGISDLDPSLVASMRDAVLQQLNPLLVVLFGSQAKGTANADSDIDLLVIDDTLFSAARSRRRIVGSLRRSMPADRHPVDVLLFDPSELRRWRGTTNHVIARALREGIVLYERPGAR